MQDYKAFSIDLAQKAGKIMQEHFKLGMEKTWKDNNTPLTVADTTINHMVIEAIAKEYPTHSVIGEEESNPKESEFVWLCDPIDGTIPFAHGVPLSTFSLALTQDGVPIVGVLYDPFLDRLFVAEKGKGAFLNNKKITVSSASSITNSVISVDAGNKYESISLFKTALARKGVKVISFASFAYGAALVAAGEFVGAVFGAKTAWDVAAVKLIIDEAGGKTTDFAGNEQRYDKPTNRFVATNGILHDEIIELLQSFTKKDKDLL